MATLASLTATQQGVVDGEAAALTTALENIIKLSVLNGRRVGSFSDLEPYRQTAVGGYFQSFVDVARKAGDVVRESGTS